MKQEKEKKGLPFFGIPKLAPYLKPYKMLFFWMVVTGTVGSGMDAIIPLFQQHAIDHFIADKTMQGVGGWLALYILVMIIQTATNYISAYGACKAELYIGRDLKRETFNHLQTLSFSYFNQNSVGYTHARVMSDTDRIASTLAWGLMEAVVHCVSAAGNRDDVRAQLEAGAVCDGHCAGAGALGRVFPEKARLLPPPRA